MRITDEQKERANLVDLPQFLMENGFDLKKVGREYVWKEHDSLHIKDNGPGERGAWFRFSEDKGGDNIGFLREYMGMSFVDAVEALTGDLPVRQAGHYDRTYTPTHTYQPKPVQQVAREISLAEADNARRVFAYLCKTRGLDYDMVSALVRGGSIAQEEKTGNVLFKYFDNAGKLIGAEKVGTSTEHKFKGIATGSASGHGFEVVRGNGDKLYFFESAIDMLSYLQMHENELQNCCLVSMMGVKPQTVIDTMNRHNISSENVFLCSDNDTAGNEFADRLRVQYPEMKRIITPDIYKDWNDMLRGIPKELKKGTEKKEVDNVADLITYGNRMWNDATDNRDKSLISMQLADFQRVQDTLEKSGINYYAYEMNGTVRMAVNDKDIDWLRNILGNVGITKSNRPYSPPEKNIFGTAEYRYIPQKEYLTADRDLVLKMGEIMAKRGLQFSGRIYPSGKGTLTVSRPDLYTVRSIRDEVINMRRQFASPEKAQEIGNRESNNIQAHDEILHNALQESDVADFLTAHKQAVIERENTDKIPTEEEVLFPQADIARFIAEHTMSSDDWEGMARPLFENGYLDNHKPNDKAAFGYHLSEPEFYALAERFRHGEDIRRELALNLLEGGNSANIEFVFEDGKISDRTFYYAENLRRNLHLEKAENGYNCTFNGMERFVSFEEIGQAFLDRTHEEFEDIAYWAILDFIKDDIPNISDDTVKALITAFDGATMHGWENGDNQPKINRIKKALYDILGNEEQTEKVFACIAKHKYNVTFEPERKPDSLEFHFGEKRDSEWFTESDLLYDFVQENPDCSFALGNAILKYLDEKQHSERGIPELKAGWYKKTNFSITAVINGEGFNYDGRFDIGDGKGTGGGSLIDHIRTYNEGILEYTQYPFNQPEYKERAKHTLDVFIPFLEAHSELTAEEQRIFEDFKTKNPIRTYDDLEKPQVRSAVTDLEVGDVILYEGKRREVEKISEHSISLKGLDAPDYGGILLGTSDVLAYNGWQQDMEEKGFEILSKSEKSAPVVDTPEQVFELNPPKHEPEKLQTLQQVVDKFFGTDCESAETEGGTWKLVIADGDKVGELFYGGEPVCGIYNRGEKMEIEPYRELTTFPELLRTAMLEHNPNKPVEIMEFQRTFETPLDKAKWLINEFSENEYEITEDFADMHNIGLAFTTLTDDELPIQVTADLVDFKITYEFGGEVYKTEQYDSIEDMIENGLTGLDFSDLVYVPDEVVERHTKKEEQTVDLMSDVTDVADISSSAEDVPAITLKYKGDSESLDEIRDKALSLGATVAVDNAEGVIFIDTYENNKAELDGLAYELGVMAVDDASVEEIADIDKPLFTNVTV